MQSFEKDFIKIERELAALKAAKLKAQSVLRTQKQTITMNFSFTWKSPWGFPILQSDKKAIITATAVDSNDHFLGALYMTTNDNRGYYLSRKFGQGYTRFIVWPYRATDAEMAQEGQNVSYSISAQIVTSSQVSLSIRYENL